MNRLSPALAWIRDLLVLLLGTTTVLFFLLRLSGDPAMVLAGPDATPEQVEEIRAQYGLDRSLPRQYLAYLGSVARLDFGRSLQDGTPALAKVLTALPASLLLGGLAMALMLAVAIPLGAWLGAKPGGAARAAARWAMF